MPTKSKLERAVEEHASKLGDAQKELVKSQLAEYRRNMARMERLADALSLVNSQSSATLGDVRAKQAERSALSYEYNQVATANSRIAADLFMLLEERS